MGGGARGMTRESSYQAAFRDLPWQTAGAGARYKLCPFGGRQLRVLELTPELFHTEWCAKGHAGYVLDGRLELRFKDHIIQCEAGEGFLIPAGEEHAHIPRSLTDCVTLFLIEDE
jgi:Cupin domain